MNLRPLKRLLLLLQHQGPAGTRGGGDQHERFHVTRQRPELQCHPRAFAVADDRDAIVVDVLALPPQVVDDGPGVVGVVGHGGGLGVVDPVADPAGALGAQGGDAGAEVGADALAAAEQVDPERPAELGHDLDADRALAGDDIVAPAPTIETRSIEIDAPPSDVWPWLVQMGYGRAGWYSYDSIDMAGGSTRRIVPEWQSLDVGDVVPTHPGGGFEVRAMLPLQSEDEAALIAGAKS